ncbi:transcriptional regulator [Bordetella genomosp. 1]|uniref:Transcriptional regulator n=1 Tax=Bordetella genomosp. 1 TaxID=1395607 RepID=A0A261RUJ6_9BORD|nr:hypothetical protein [Bordetella genomosp. 1]OZI28748.1 transcriptional regulator [Bordetella genomosp. 1]
MSSLAAVHSPPAGFSRWDAAQALEADEAAAMYLAACLAEDPGDGRLVHAALGDIVRVRGLDRAAQQICVAPETLGRALVAHESPAFNAILAQIRVRGRSLRVDIAGA